MGYTGHRRVRSLAAFSCAMLLLAMIGALATFADDPPPDDPYIASENDDLDGDDIKDTVLASPDGTSTQPRSGQIMDKSGQPPLFACSFRGRPSGAGRNF